MKKIILLGLTVALVSSCVSTEKLLETGAYEELITRATRKLAGNKKHDQIVFALEEGFKKLSVEELNKIDSYKKTNTAESWESALNIAYRIESIQNKIKPLLPLVSEKGHRANIKFVNTTEIIKEARTTAASIYYIKLTNLTNEAYAGNKKAAREAYHMINRIDDLSGDYDLVRLKNEMHLAGINKIVLNIEDRSLGRLPRRIYDELNFIPLSNDIHDWNRYYTETGEEDEMDYKVVYRILEWGADREQYRTVENTYRKEITDGWEYILDANGNVIKDSSGNDIKRERKIKVNATVTETIQSKRAYIRGYMEVIHIKTGDISLSKRLDFEDWFTHRSRNFTGDPRALESSMIRRIDPIRCPDDLDMMLKVAEIAKTAFVDEVNRVNYF